MKKTTNKYTICFESLETQMSTEIKISEKEYKKQLDFLRRQLKETVGNECPMEAGERIIRENAQMIVTQQRFSVSCGDTYLTHYQCKPGFCFKSV